MVNRPQNTANKSYEYSSFPILGVLGTLLVASGVLALVSLFIGVKGAFFGSIQTAVKGLGGCLSIGLPVILIWGGLLLMLSNGRKVSFRAFLLVSLIYFIALALLNLLSRIGEDGFFVDYCVTRLQFVNQPTSFVNTFGEAYRFCALYGEPGGALGMLLAWPAHRFLGTAFGVVVLIVAMLAVVMWLFRFNLTGRLAEMREAAAIRRQEKAQMRAHQEEQQRIWEQQRQQEQNLNDLNRPAYLRRGMQPQPMQQPVPFAPQNTQPVERQPLLSNNGFAATPSMQSLHPGKPVVRPAIKPDVELYDETIDIGNHQPEDSGSWRPSGSKATKVHQTRMTFTPSEMGYTDGENDAASKKDHEVGVTGKRRKNTARLEEIRKRKAELVQRLEENERARQNEQPVSEEMITSTASAVYEPPVQVPEAQPEPEWAPPKPEEYHPLVEDDSDFILEEESEKAPSKLHMPEDPQQHTPMFAPLIDMDDEEDEPEVPEKRPYIFPPVDLLNLEQHKVKDTHEADQENAQKLEETLRSFNIPAKVQHITHGPAITRFALGLMASGINVKRIQNIADNIALDLAADGAIRIESQIPGTNLFGIEVPNKEVQTVTFAQVLMSPEMQQATSPLAVGLGHDISGKPIICDLSKMPHLLIAGQTGSGKSVCVNTIINSLLFRASPDDVRMIMIDPKVVELQCYNVVPHLLIPVVSDPHKAAGALAWAVAEMEDRYNKMQTKNVRELSAYNAKLGPDEPKLPRIVIIIDELADLMMASKRDVEESIIRLAQKARAAGIHIVVATQRPTVDVITGLIKSNVPSRIAFAVSSIVDSRTILDKVGAEKLLGRGDMLYMPTGIKAPVRVQGCFLSDAETERIVDYIGKYSRVEFDPDVMEALERQDDGNADALDDGGSDGSVDDRLEEAIEMVITDGQASISMLQRRLKVGYARAGRLIDDMAARGIVSKSLGSKPREVLITREEYDRIKSTLLS